MKRFFSARAIAAAAVVPVLLLATACNDDKKSGGAADGPKGGGKALTLDQLRAAVLTDADVPGWQVKPDTTQDDGSKPNSDKADRPECQPILDLISGDKEHTPPLSVGAAVSKADNPKLVHLVALGQFDGDKASKMLSSAKAAVAKCASFNGTEDDGTKTAYSVKAGTALPFGSDAFTLEYAMDGEAASNTVQLTRSGSVMVLATSMNFDTTSSDAVAMPPVPQELVKAQFDKLAKAQKG